MSNLELYTKDARVWIPDADRVWKAGRLMENYEPTVTNLKILIEDDQIEINYDIQSNQVPNPKLPPLRNPDILIGQNDLTALSYLNEPEVLYNLEVRFLTSNQIYTYCGIVLVAINPYESLPIYGNETIQAYNGRDVQNMDPHIFSVSESAFQKMIQFDQNQSIIVSGESGAGKTVSAKYAMRYFANVGGSSEETQVEKKVLASNPIMEAFGNAKTTRNDNSSRFGKFIQIDFNRSHHIVGGSMKTYLLEKSRVVFQAPHERNYHIFYQLCSQCDKKEYEYLRLAAASKFVYTNQGEAEQIDNVDDNQVFKDTLDAFKLLDISKKDQVVIFSLISAILHLGNVRISGEKSNEASFVAKNDQSISIMCDLLKIDENHMRAWLCNKRIKTVNEVVNTPLTLSQALFSRDALAKHMYSQLFNWVVSQINKCLKSPVKTHSFIGVLDIYGFETFQINSFEQFCINYANEKLQQQFCQHVFKLEQEEYVREQIKWSFIEFYDNQPCIELIEGKIGILDLLDEECKMPKGSDLTWCNKLYDKHLKSGTTGGKNHFSKPRMSQKSFIIHHFAENVEYQVDGFLEKNRDTVLEEQLKVLKYSEIEFISEIFCEDSDESKPKGYEVKRNTMPAPTKTQMIRKKTVGSQFRESLNNLMTALNSTTPHYVRCIKPNDLKAPFKFEAKRAVEQLRACGVLETVRISAAGYPSRWTYQEFFQRYRMLFKTLSSINRSNLKETCENILKSLIKDEAKYQFGKSKIFFQAGQVAYLEKLRSDKLKSAGIMIQKHIRGWLARSKFNKIKKSCLLIQCQSRGLLARRLLKHKKETRAAITIQSNWRAYVARKKYLKIKMDCVKLQSLCRGYLARKNRQLMILNVKATLIQAHVRGWLARIKYKKVHRGITLLQAHYRRRKARQLFKTLKIEARSVEHQKQLNKGLENKIISLQQQIEKINKERDLLSQKVIELEPLKSQIITLKQTSTQAKESSIKLNELNEELSQLKENYNRTKVERDELIKEKSRMEKMHRESTSKSNQEISLLKSRLEESETKIVSLQVRIDQMKSQLNELENERANHQKLITEYSKLEQRFEKVKSDLLRLSNKNLNSTISLSSSTTSIPPPYQQNLELESLIEELEQDSKTRSTTTTTTSSSLAQDVANFEANKLLYMTPNGSEMDLRLISKLQRRIASLEMERKESNFSRASKTLGVDNDDEQQAHNKSFLIERLQMEKDYEMIKSQELELENQKLREDLNRLRDLIADNQSARTDSPNQINKEMMGQFDVLNEEVQRRRDECIHLKSLLIAKHRQQQRNNGENNSLNDADMDALSDMSQIDTNGTNEFEIGYNTQKILNRILENQISDMKKSYDLDKANFVREIQNLNDEYEKQQELLMQNMPPEHLVDATYKNEIMKLTQHNLELSEKCDQYSEEIKKYKKMLKVYIKRSKTINIGDRFALNSSSTVSMNGLNSTAIINDADRSINTVLNQTTNTLTPNYSNNNLAHRLNTNLNSSSSIYMPQIRSKHTGDYLGILEWKVEDEPKIIGKLIDDLKPRLALTFLPGLPAYILFMCIRYADMSNDDEKVRLLLNSSVQSVKRLIKKKQEDLDYLVLWMTNFCRLIHNLKQYSGDEMFQSQNTPKQNEHCLKNFDLTEYRGIFSDISIWLFQGIIKDFEKKINPIIVGAMLEHDALSINDIKPNKSGVLLNQNNVSSTSSSSHQQSRITLETLTKKLNEFLNTLNSHGVDPEIVNQIFKQLFFFIGATTFNNLILRKEMCNWSKGIELRYNTSLLEQWVRDSKLHDSGACEMLEPVIQASQLLQARKSESDIQTICDMCPKLTIAQIQRILFWYTPLESFEEKLSRQFIDKVTDKLKEIRKTEQNSVQQVLVIDTQKQFPVCIPFNPSNIGLETIEMPDAIGLAPYVRKI